MNIILKRIIAVALCLVISAVMIGCNDNNIGANTEDKDASGNVQLPAIGFDLTFSSGTGAWSTVMKLSKDGSFTGEYHDSDMGDANVVYRDGTVYISKFSGKFTNIKKIDDNTYKMELEELKLEKIEGEEWLEDNIRYISTKPYGLETGKEFTLYTPDKETADLSEEFISWWPYKETEEGKLPEKLLCYGLCNEETQYGFFTYQ